MTLKKINKKQHRIIIADRRRMVASLYLRGLTQEAIVAALENDQRVNPETLEPWAIGTINSDIKAIKKQWEKEISQEVTGAKAKQLAEIREARSLAWRSKDLRQVYKGLEMEIALLGTNAPSKTHHSGSISNFDPSNYTLEQLERIANGEMPEQVEDDS